MGSPPQVSVAHVPVSCAPPASRWPTPSAPLAGAPPVSGPPPGSYRHHVRTPAGSARIVPLWLSCSPKPSFLLGQRPKQGTRFMVYRWGQISIERGQFRVANSAQYENRIHAELEVFSTAEDDCIYV